MWRGWKRVLEGTTVGEFCWHGLPRGPLWPSLGLDAERGRDWVWPSRGLLDPWERCGIPCWGTTQKKNPKLKRAPAPNSVSSSDTEHSACEKKKPQLQFCVLQYVIADGGVMPDLYETQAYLILKEDSIWPSRKCSEKPVFLLHCRSSPVIVSSCASMLGWNTMLSGTLFPSFAAVAVHSVFGITLLLYWCQTSWWIMCVKHSKSVLNLVWK